jgi:hypothetical protein
MKADAAPEPHEDGAAQDYRRLPPQVRLEETIAGVDPDPVPDPQAGQNVDQRRALQDD